MKDDITYRRIIGLSLGAGLGMVYGIVSQSVNLFALPGIPLYQPPLGMAGNVLVWCVIGAVLGLISAWPTETLAGAFLGGITGALILTILTLSTGRMDTEVWASKIISVTFLILPFVGLLTPLLGIFRWVVNKVVEAHFESKSIWVTIRMPILLMLLVGVIGTFTLLRPYARIMLSRTNTMLKGGLESSTTDQLPAPLQGRRVGGFLDQAGSEYSLEWQNRNINRFGIPRPMSSRPWEESVVIARFDNGWDLVCMYAKSDAEPVCQGYTNRE